MNAVRNDIAVFERDLKEHIPVYLLAAPAAVNAIDDFERVLGFLRALGVKACYPVLPYADISVWAYYRFLRENAVGSMLTSFCARMRNFLADGESPRAQPDCMPAPLDSPLVCAAKYLRAYRGITGRLAFLSPCAFKWREFTDSEGRQLLHYHLPIESFITWLEAQNANLSEYAPCPLEHDGAVTGVTVGALGSFSKALALLFDSLSYALVDGTDAVASYLRNNSPLPHVVEAYACKGGCSNGGAVGQCAAKRLASARAQPQSQPCERAQREAIMRCFAYYDEHLDVERFYTTRKALRQ